MAVELQCQLHTILQPFLPCCFAKYIILQLECMMTLICPYYTQAVHSGADLESAISNCMGYRSEVILELG